MRTEIVRKGFRDHKIGAKIRHMRRLVVAECTLSGKYRSGTYSALEVPGFLVGFLITELGDGYVDVGK
jgi:hypothetical protein